MIEKIELEHMVTVQGKFGFRTVIDPEYIDEKIDIVDRKEGFIWDHIEAEIKIDQPRRIKYLFGPLDAIRTYMLYGTEFEWYGIKLKALRKLKL